MAHRQDIVNQIVIVWIWDGGKAAYQLFRAATKQCPGWETASMMKQVNKLHTQVSGWGHGIMDRAC